MIPLLECYRLKIDRQIAEAIEQMGEPSRLRDACAYALQSDGKRLRPILVHLVAEAIGDRDVSAAALCVEYFHTASLIADDLPCMDNDDFRRNKPSLHKAFGESVALLASYTLIAAGYGGIYEASRLLKEKMPQESARLDAITVTCLDIVTRCAGLRGATHGQFLDLFPPDATYETAFTIIQRKTATLFEIAFVLGWLFGGGSENRLDEVKESAAHFGVAFQIADDLDDMLQDKHASHSNIAKMFGIEKAQALFQNEADRFSQSLRSLGLETEPFRQINQLLARRARSGLPV
jgi:geranylgeranyl diphosphate synthase, type II